MCPGHTHDGCRGCGLAMTRRDLLRGAGAATAAAAGLISAAPAGEKARARRVRVAAVFLSNTRIREIWPHPGFDAGARQKEILALLRKGCGEIEFVPVTVEGDRQTERALALRDKVDGFAVFVLTLDWSQRNSILRIAKLGKPTVLVDDYLGGSGVFLTGYSALCDQKVPVAAVSTTRPDDLVAVIGRFASARDPGVTAASFARQCWKLYRGTFPPVGRGPCRDDDVCLTDTAECVKRFRSSRFLIVGRGRAGQVQDYLGAKGVSMDFAELKALYEKVDPAAAAEWARRWSKRAERVVEPKADAVRNAAAVYLATLELLEKHKADTVTMNCLGGFASGKLPAYPCLGFMQILDDGGQGVCEAMPDDSLSMLMARILTGRPGYVSDPALDTSKNQICYAHCVATTKVFGPKGPSNTFRIRTLHNRDPRGACAQSFLPEGYMTTSFRTNHRRKQMVIHQARSVGHVDNERGCRTRMVAEVRGDIGKLFDQWGRFGWHRVTVYGDVKAPLTEFAKALGLSVIEEA